MADKQIAGLTAGTIGLTDVLPFQDAAAASEAKKATVSELQDAMTGKQDTLESSTNIKTINSTSLLGSGDVEVQETLVSGTNIKTINGSSVLGSGDLTISGGVEGVTGFGVDNTDPLNPIIGVYANGNITATGTTFFDAAVVTTIHTVINAGGADTGVFLENTGVVVGSVFSIVNSTSTTKKLYTRTMLVNGVTINNSFIILQPQTAFILTLVGLAGGGGWVVNQEQVAPYKVYSFYAEQFSTNAPVVNEEQNTTGATITWSRVPTGRIRGTASSAIFTANKTTVLISGNGGDVNSPVLLMPVVVSTTVIDIVSYSSSFVKQDGFNLSGEIKIYP